MTSTAPKVSVCVVTYNHEDYVYRCLQSIVDQETDFDFEVIVGDDGSTDGTRAIIEEFAARYPGVIVPVLHARNGGPTWNYSSVHGRARAELVCHCDGDDYWLPGKLQAQADFMDANPECNLCGHRMYRATEGGSMFEDGRGDCSILQTQMDISAFYRHGNFLAHSSTMYRARCGRVPPTTGVTTDYLTHIWRIGGGKIGYIKQYLGVYRIHQQSVTARMSNSLFHFDFNLAALEEIHKIVQDEDELEKRKFALFARCIKNYMANGRTELAREIASRSKDHISRRSYNLLLGAMIRCGELVRLAVLLKRRLAAAGS